MCYTERLLIKKKFYQRNRSKSGDKGGGCKVRWEKQKKQKKIVDIIV